MKRFLMAILMMSSLLSGQDKQYKTYIDSQTLTPMIDLRTPSNPYYSRTDTAVLDLPDSVWKTVLPDSVFAVARGKATEEAFTGKFWDYSGVGTYYCAACGNALFRSDAKFASSCGWPSFFET